MGLLGLLSIWVFLVWATTAVSAIITIVKDLPFLFPTSTFPKFFYSLVKMCIEPKCALLSELNDREGFA